ncbi:MAG TPA: ABC-F type ribosomal protection protein [Symbiobacteriaceae bacterium]|nr:ABC-F type ribosomal protection protein [Symbiobacteriaceae bacterium]
MMVLQARNVTKEYQGIPVLTGVTFHLAGGERVGLVGTNGCGKSTLMKILAGALPADGGVISWVTDGLSRAYLSQESPFDPDRPLGEQLTQVPDDLLARCGVTKAMLARTPGALSGGQKTRAALAQALAGKPDLLMLDEPTNHLDTEGLTWLETILASYRGTVLVVSHDRYFLDRVATRILEMEKGQVKEYPGNYSAYARQKQLELEQAKEEYRNYVNEKKRIEAAIRQRMEWAEKGHNKKLGRTEGRFQEGIDKNAARDLHRGAKNMQKRLERIKVEKPREARAINLRIDDEGGGGKNLILAEDLGFTYDGTRWLFRHAGFYVQRGEKAAIVGPNGAGKTTLLKLLLGGLAPTEGRLYCSPLKVAYLAQELETLNPANTVLTEATGNSAMDQAYARSLLGCLLFSGEDVLKPVAVLSGGEKVRLALAKILLAAPDLLVLDEPTNGLDLPSRERVEEALADYPGTLLLVSHDRYLLQRVATSIVHIEGGKLAAFGGGYDQFLARGQKRPEEDRQAERILLEMRLAQLSAQLAAPPEAEKERLNAEFFAVSRQLRALRA